MTTTKSLESSKSRTTARLSLFVAIKISGTQPRVKLLSAKSVGSSSPRDNHATGPGIKWNRRHVALIVFSPPRAPLSC